jgi:hypothetical protein
MDKGSDQDDPQDHTPTTSAYTIYIPTFLDDIHQSQRPLLSNLNTDLLLQKKGMQKWVQPMHCHTN